MAKTSKFIKVDTNILLEWQYTNENLIGEAYKILTNQELQRNLYLATDTSGTNNTKNKSLIPIDPIDNRWGLIDEEQYNFIGIKDFSAPIPIRHDKLIVHLPINYTFDEHIGFHIRIWTLDYKNNKEYELSSYFFDQTDPNRDDLNFSSQQLQFGEKLWGKNITLEIPSPYSLALQRESGNATPNTINSNLTNNTGLSQNSPIIIEFSFISKKDEINSLTTYLLRELRTVSFPQVPEFENLAVRIEESNMGDFFEIVGIFNNNPGEFNNFIRNQFSIGNRFFVEYIVTIFEENIKGKTFRYTVTEEFDEPLEFRPIIKFSTTTAVIDVEMRLVNRLDDSQIVRKASYGMLSDQVSKYSLSLTKINIANAVKPKIYNLKNVLDMSGISSLNGNGGDGIAVGPSSGVEFEQVRVPFPVLNSTNNIVAKSDNVKIGKNKFFGNGKLRLTIYPFDNIVKFIIAFDTEKDGKKVKYFDLTGHNNIKLIFKNTNISQEVPLWTESDEIDLETGRLVFKIFERQIGDIRQIYQSNINAFYIVSTNNNNTTVIYSGLFTMFDSQQNINQLNLERDTDEGEVSEEDTQQIISDPDLERETGVITRIRDSVNLEPINIPRPQVDLSSLRTFRRN